MLQLRQNLYLHFLDRELRQSVTANWTPSILGKAMLAAVCLARSSLVCSFSHLWESSELISSYGDVFRELARLDLLRPASRYATPTEFLESRISLYEHDAERYRCYFESAPAQALGAISPGILLAEGSTQCLENQLRIAAESLDYLATPKRKDVAALLIHGLNARGDRAITGTLFDDLTGATAASSSFIRREISLRYTQHYMRECDCDILTGLSAFRAFEAIAVSPPVYDASLLMKAFVAAGLSCQGDREIRSLLEHAVLESAREDATVFRESWAALLTDAVTVKGRQAGAYVEEQLRLRRGAGKLVHQTSNPFRALSDLLAGLPQGRPIHVYAKPQETIALVVATDTEFAVLNRLIAREGGHLHGTRVDRIAMWKVTGILSNRVLLVRTEMGTKGSSASTLVAADLIRDVKPTHIIMPGIAFGLKEAKQKIGDLLVAASIRDYETVRLGEGKLIERGEYGRADANLLSKARYVKGSRKDVYFGEVLSGEKLVDDPKFRAKLKKRFPEALGGEMEGAGLAASCHRYGVPFLLVKGICDWGMAKNNVHKDQDQKMAAEKSVRFCLDIVAHL